MHISDYIFILEEYSERDCKCTVSDFGYCNSCKASKALNELYDVAETCLEEIKLDEEEE